MRARRTRQTRSRRRALHWPKSSQSRPRGTKRAPQAPTTTGPGLRMTRTRPCAALVRRQLVRPPRRSTLCQHEFSASPLSIQDVHNRGCIKSHRFECSKSAHGSVFHGAVTKRHRAGAAEDLDLRAVLGEPAPGGRAAPNPLTRRQRHSVAALVERHGDDIPAMVKDAKLNTALIPAGKLRKMVLAYHMYPEGAQVPFQQPKKGLW